MSSDPDHVLDAIDGVVDEWLAMSDDSMRWMPPEKTPPKARLALPTPPLPHVFEELLQEVGTQAQTAIEAFRPLGEGVVGVFNAFLDSSPVRHLIELTGPSEERMSLDEAERGELLPWSSPAELTPAEPPPAEPPSAEPPPAESTER
jgi:hypothetical protein